jgi:prophage regulatory protein
MFMHAKSPSSRRILLRKAEMKRRTGEFHDATYYRWEAQGLFPKRVQIGPNCIGWYEDEIDAWASSRERVADAPAPGAPPKRSLNWKARRHALAGAAP